MKRPPSKGEGNNPLPLPTAGTPGAKQRSGQRPPPRIREPALLKETGRGWEEWFQVLAYFGAASRGEADSVRFLRDEHRLTRCTARVIVARYLAEHGLRPSRKKAAAAREVRLSRTIGAAPEAVYDAWTRPHLLTRWLTTRARNQLRAGGRYEMAGGTRGRYLELDPPRKIRMSWDHERQCPGTEVAVSIARKGKGRSQLRLVHRPLATREDEVRMREIWSTALDALQTFLEGGSGGDLHLWIQARS
ncbi:MAG: SRPBCC domain-containing protein [Planctomycetes bacterium]|nr:SRPBCC domain-containing protein [Planctomycetota bacterium]